ncbi:hypothetical protein Sste5346_006134 [Sporothrix stenoceras]|uniref:Cytochrome P450 n=1 Tax=Sporothrix stenoceras TaxID=5173 RepID=A0ABR3Z1C2_9PEZI
MTAAGFSSRSLLDQEATIKQFGNDLVEVVKERTAGGKSINLVSFLNWTTFDVLGELAFGQSFNSLKTRQVEGWVGIILGNMKFHAWDVSLWKLPALPHIQYWLTPVKPVEVGFKHAEDSMKKVQRRLADITTKKRDFFSYILPKREGLGITDWGLASYTNALIVASSETSATTLSDERVYSTLKAEIRGAFKTPAAITALTLSTLPYLTACIEEALRIYPPIPIALPRLMPKGGCVIDGYSVPGSTTVGVYAWTVTRDPRRFKDPDTFRPECWIDNTDNDNLEASRPCLAGTRMCMGINMAWIEARLFAVKLVLSFDMEMVDTTLDRNEQECYTL